MDLFDQFMQPKGRKRGKRFTVPMGSPGPDAEAAVRALVELGKRQKVGKRLGASEVIKAERR